MHNWVETVAALDGAADVAYCMQPCTVTETRPEWARAVASPSHRLARLQDAHLGGDRAAEVLEACRAERQDTRTRGDG
jgi:hypothetical protein